MHRIIVLFLVSFSLLSHLFAQTGVDSAMVKVEFVLKAPTIGDNINLYITGSHQNLAVWNPNKIKLDYLGNKKWGKTVELPKGAKVEYKFAQDGGWEREGLDPNGYPLSNFAFVPDTDTVVVSTIYFWKSFGAKARLKGQVTGMTELIKGFSSAGFAPRDIIVWLPPTYYQSKEKYPVIYMQDGQNLFDPHTSYMGYDWQVDEVVDSLIKNQLIKDVIIVGIYNNYDERNYEYSPSSQGNIYMDYLTFVIKPFMDAKYRTMPEQKHTFIGGANKGAAISLLTAFKYPTVYGTVLCLSPEFKTNETNFLTEIDLIKYPLKDITVYIDNGGDDVEKSNQPHIDDMLLELDYKGFKQDQNLFVRSYPNALFHHRDWGDRFDDILLHFLKK